jgi:hypothetical protein
MTEEHDAIDEYVRRVMPIGDEALARLTDPRAKQDLLDRILRQPVAGGEVPAARIRWTRWIRRPRLALAGAAAAVLLAGGIGAVVALGGPGSPDADPPLAASAPPVSEAGESVAIGGEAMNCVEAYGPETLANRAFAFDGTVTGIAEAAPDDELSIIADVEVTFRIEQWLRGGDAGQFTVSMIPPDADTSAGNGSYQVGSRLLVSGEDRWGDEQLSDPVVWYCGFTRTYSAGAAEQWRQAFAGG